MPNRHCTLRWANSNLHSHFDLVSPSLKGRLNMTPTLEVRTHAHTHRSHCFVRDRRGGTRHDLLRRCVHAIAILLFTATLCSAQAFTDGFEEATINSFWTVDMSAGGSAALTASPNHSGNQSLAAFWPVGVKHDYGSPQTGSLSVWMLASQLYGGAASDLEVYNAQGTKWVSLQQGSNCSACFMFRSSSEGNPDTNVDYEFTASNSDWHHIEIRVDSGGAIVKFDGTIVGSDPSVTEFQFVHFAVWGSVAPGALAYYDDFWIDATPVQQYSVCLLYDKTKAHKSGSTIPIKLQLCSSTGDDLSSANIGLHAVGITQDSSSISGAVEDSGNANPDSDFRFDPSLASTGGYIFNLSTRGLATGSYKLNFTVTGDSNTVRSAVPSKVSIAASRADRTVRSALLAESRASILVAPEPDVRCWPSTSGSARAELERIHVLRADIAEQHRRAVG